MLITLVVILFALCVFSKKPLLPSEYLLLILSLIVLLTVGVTTLMIDMGAAISQLSFELMGHSIRFEDQVLYFQSKNILDVFWIMISHKMMEMKLVGVLLLTFSILFPLFKILSSLGYYCNYRNLEANVVIKFFVLTPANGRWSM